MSTRGALVVLVCATVAACGGRPDDRALFRLPASETVLIVQRQAMHAFLAEYHRDALLYTRDTLRLRVALFDDTGGHSRANLYRLDDTRFVLRDAEASYTIDVNPPSFTRDPLRRRAGAFMGSFDVDASGTWRFISGEERPELATEF
jgi:hypothetical protein